MASFQQPKDTAGSAPRFHYAWIVAAVTFVILLVTAGIRATPGVLMVPLEAEFGWSRAAISAAVAINIALFGLIGPFAASAMDRWGMRRLILAALALLAVSVALTHADAAPVADDAAVGRLRRHRHRRDVDGAGRRRRDALVRWRGAGWCSARCRRRTPPGNWCSCRCWRGVVEAAGWRAAALIVAGAAVVVFVVVLVFMRDRPEDIGLLPYGRAVDGSRAGAARHSRRSPRCAWPSGRAAFWVLAGTFFVCGASTNGLIGTHLIAACHDYGISEIRSAQLLAVMGIFDIVGTTASGWLTRSLLEPPPAVRLLHAARPVAPLPAVHAAERRRRPRRVRGVLRARLDRDRAADRQAHQRGVRPGEHRRRSTAGSAPATSSARRWPRSAPGRSAPSPAATSWRSGLPGSCACWPAWRFSRWGGDRFAPLPASGSLAAASA